MQFMRDLEEYGKRISQDYLTKQEPLESSLIKVAEEQGLNRQQINRVAETANTETYLSLMKTSESKYITFDLADAEKAHKAITSPSKTARDFNDYDTSVLLFDPKNLEKAAETEVKTPEKSDKEFERLEGILRVLDNGLGDASADLSRHYTRMEEEMKQSILAGDVFADTAAVVKVAAVAIADRLLPEIKENFSKIMPRHINLDTAPTECIINPESNLYKQAQTVAYYAQRLGEISNALSIYKAEYEKAATDVNRPMLYKEAGVSRVLKDLAAFALKHKYITGAAVTLPLAYASGKKMGLAEKGSLLQDALLKVGPDRRIERVFR